MSTIERNSSNLIDSKQGQRTQNSSQQYKTGGLQGNNNSTPSQNNQSTNNGISKSDQRFVSTNARTQEVYSNKETNKQVHNGYTGKKEDLTSESVNLRNDFVKPQHYSQIDKQNLKFDFEGPPVHKVGVRVQNSGLTETLPRVNNDIQRMEIKRFNNDFNNKVGPSNLDKKGMKFDFEREPQVNRKVNGGSSQLPSETLAGSDPNQPVENVKLYQNFTKRPNPADFDKSNLKFDFEAVPQNNNEDRNNRQVNLNNQNWNQNTTQRQGDINQNNLSQSQNNNPLLNNFNQQYKSEIGNSINKSTNNLLYNADANNYYQKQENNFYNNVNSTAITKNANVRVGSDNNGLLNSSTRTPDINNSYNSNLTTNNINKNIVTGNPNINPLNNKYGVDGTNRQIFVTSKHNVNNNNLNIDDELNKKFGKLNVREEKQNFKVYRVADQFNGNYEKNNLGQNRNSSDRTNESQQQYGNVYTKQ